MKRNKSSKRRSLSPLSVSVWARARAGRSSRGFFLQAWLACSLSRWPRGTAQLHLSLSLSFSRGDSPSNSCFRKSNSKGKNASLVQMRRWGQPLHRTLFRRLHLRREGHARLRCRDDVDRVLDGGAGEESRKRRKRKKKASTMARRRPCSA